DQELRQFSTVWLKLAKVSRLGVSCTRQVDFQRCGSQLSLLKLFLHRRHRVQKGEDARHYTLYTGISGSILSSVKWITCSKRMQGSRVYNSYVKRPRINKRDFLAQVPTFQYQCPVITNVHIWNGQIERDLQGEVERINAK
ncbi:hypothetical protein S83_012121, partial [Arachis hypogaea]